MHWQLTGLFGVDKNETDIGDRHPSFAFGTKLNITRDDYTSTPHVVCTRQAFSHLTIQLPLRSA
jgi:hypothetical protein